MITAAWPVYPIAHKYAKSSAVNGYQQFLNGIIVSTDMVTFECTRDGPCKQTYDCDKYYVTVVDQAAYTDKDGVYHSEVSHEEPRWHQCPFATREFSFKATGLAWKSFSWTMAANWLAEKPQRWKNRSIPSELKRGIPQRWQAIKDSIAQGYAQPITVPDSYANYILSNEKTLLRESSDDIDALRKAKLLPPHVANLNKDPIYGDFLADKMSFVGFTPANANTWQDRLMRFNAMLGTELEGDMATLAIKDSALSSAHVTQTQFSQAVKTNWLNNQGKKAFAKNGIGLVLGISDDGTTILWAQAFTGMPIGNGILMSRLNSLLRNVPFDPDVVFGKIGARVVKNDKGKLKPQFDPNPQGIVPHTVMVDTPFLRACMEKCDDKKEKGQTGFVSLQNEIPISTAGKVWASIFIIFVMMGLSFLGYNYLSTMGSPPEFSPNVRRKRNSYPYRTHPRSTP